MNRQKAYIYSRITPFSSESVLDYQIHKLVKFAQEQDLEIEYVSHSVGMNLLDEGDFFNELMSLIRKEVFDVLVIWRSIWNFHNRCSKNICFWFFGSSRIRLFNNNTIL